MVSRIATFIGMAAITAAIILTGCAKKSDKILIGEFNAFTGQIADFGKSTHKGITLAMEEINKAGGLLGKEVELKSEDDQSDQTKARLAAEKLVAHDKVIALLGEVASSNTLAATSVAKDYKIPLITPASTNPDVTKGKPFVFRVCFTDDFQGAVCAEFARKNLKTSNAAIFQDVNSDYSKGLADAFKRTFERKGGKIVVQSAFSQNDQDFKSQLTTIKAAKPDVIFIPGYYTQVSLIAVQARQLGIRVPMIGGDGWDSPSLLPTAAGALEKCYFSTHFTPMDTKPTVTMFVKAFKAKYHEDPNAMAALGYDATWILAEAIKTAGSTGGDDIRKALTEIKDYPGVTGRITIDANRNANKPAVVVQIRGREFRPVAYITPEQVKL